MTLRVAIQMDHISSINIHTDSTFMLALEAQRRGHKLFHYLPRDLSLKNGVLTAHMQALSVQREGGGRHFTLDHLETQNLKDFDIILMRQDPPFDMAYITATHLLEHVSDKVLVINNPAEVRNAPEKLFVTHYPDLMPPTLISASRDDILAFRREYKNIILKPLYGNGGSQIFHVKPDDDNINALLEMFSQMYREPIIAQKYLPEIRQGDKRIILIDGRPAGAVLRVPADGEARANFHAGGRAQKTELTAREQDICARIEPELKRRGLVFVGIDVIGDYITEINVTSPTGLQEINALNGCALETELWDAFERKISLKVA
jgi:glutathione synthase